MSSTNNYLSEKLEILTEVVKIYTRMEKYYGRYVSQLQMEISEIRSNRRLELYDSVPVDEHIKALNFGDYIRGETQRLELLKLKLKNLQLGFTQGVE